MKTFTKNEIDTFIINVMNDVVQPSREITTEVITYLATMYYNGEAVVTDYEFDRLVNKLLLIGYGDLEVLNKTGWGFTPFQDNKFEHKFGPVKGISSKVRNQQELNNALGNERETFYVVTPKLDGGGVVVYYKNGKLEKALSRGDGRFGVDVTKTIKQLKSVPSSIPCKEEIAIRGEIIIPFKNSLGITTVRNQAVGYSQRIDSTLSEAESYEVMFIPYGILSEVTPSKTFELGIIESWGFLAISYCCLPKSKIINFESWLEESTIDPEGLGSHEHKFLLNNLFLEETVIKIPIDGYIIEPNTYSEAL